MEPVNLLDQLHECLLGERKYGFAIRDELGCIFPTFVKYIEEQCGTAIRMHGKIIHKPYTAGHSLVLSEQHSIHRKYYYQNIMVRRPDGRVGVRPKQIPTKRKRIVTLRTIDHNRPVKREKLTAEPVKREVKMEIDQPNPSDDIVDLTAGSLAHPIKVEDAAEFSIDGSTQDGSAEEFINLDDEPDCARLRPWIWFPRK